MELDFAKSGRSSVGVEWELQLVDKDSNDLRQAADTIFEEAQDSSELGPLVRREMLLNTVEVASGAHQSVEACMGDLRFAVGKLRPFTDALRIDLATAGSHPFARPAYQRVTDSQRYQELVERTQYGGRQMLLYGVHVHVGVEDREKVLPIVNAVVTRAGQLQALAASSPFWSGQDTGYASNRSMVFQQLPTAGLPPQFQAWHDLERYHWGMKKTGVIDSFDELRWDVRPSPNLGTVEVRIFDACTNILEVEAMASLTHSLVEHYSRMYDAGEPLPQLPDWFISENKWRSARYGLDAKLIVDEQGNQENAVRTVENMLEELEPVAADLGCASGLQKVQDILEVGPSYQRQRQVAAADPTYALDTVVELMRSEMVADRPLSLEEFMDTRRASPNNVGAGLRY